MGVHCVCVVLLMVVALFRNTHATPPTTTSKMTALEFAVQPNPLTMTPNDDQGHKFLRTGSPTSGDDEERGGMINALLAKILPQTKIRPQTLAAWLEYGKPIDKVFTLFQFRKSVDKLLESPQFVALVKYADDFNVKYPEHPVSMIPSLTAHYGDESLAKALEAAKKVPATEALATKLQAQQTQYWAATGKPPGDVLKLLVVDDGADNLFSHPQFLAWIKYADDFNAKNPYKAVPTISTLAARYGDATLYKMLSTLAAHYGDDTLFKMLEAAKKIPTTEAVATKMQIEQIRGWLREKKSPVAVFKVFELNNVGDTVLGSPQFNTWLNYLKAFNDQNPTMKVSRLKPLSRFYSYESIADIIETAMKNPTTVKIAKQLQTEWLNAWLRRGISPNDTFYFFIIYKLRTKYVPFYGGTSTSIYFVKNNEVPNGLLATSDFTIWTKYLEDFNKMYPNKKTNMIQTFRENCSDEALVQMLASATKNPFTEKLASNLQGALLNTWLRDQKTPVEASKFLNVGMSDDAKIHGEIQLSAD